MAHITKEQIACGASANIGDTFIHEGTCYIAKDTPNKSCGDTCCNGCEFIRDDDCGDHAPDCVKQDVIYIRAE